MSKLANRPLRKLRIIGALLVAGAVILIGVLALVEGLQPERQLEQYLEAADPRIWVVHAAPPVLDISVNLRSETDSFTSLREADEVARAVGEHLHRRNPKLAGLSQVAMTFYGRSESGGLPVMDATFDYDVLASAKPDPEGRESIFSRAVRVEVSAMARGIVRWCLSEQLKGAQNPVCADQYWMPQVSGGTEVKPLKLPRLHPNGDR